MEPRIKWRAGVFESQFKAAGNLITNLPEAFKIFTEKNYVNDEIKQIAGTLELLRRAMTGEISIEEYHLASQNVIKEGLERNIKYAKIFTPGKEKLMEETLEILKQEMV
jgi:hypothetical protein